MSRIIHNLPTVLLRHNLPDDTHHYDWMIARDRAAERPLITYRLEQVLFDLSVGESLLAKQIGDHRPVWLEKEGLVSGGRGEVRRLRRGFAHICLEEPESRTLSIVWEGDIRQRIDIKVEKMPLCRIFALPFEARIGHNGGVLPPTTSSGHSG